jgi:ubiquinone/menaquinone biosynthesis C-methylase UbiE
MTASETRWKEAQSYEKSFWQNIVKKAQTGQDVLSWYDWRARNFMEMVKKAFPNTPPSFSSAKVLEIGSGPIGIVSHLDAAECVAIDPLCKFYSSQPELLKYRNDRARYLNGKGEDLPFEADAFDLLIIENVIDHVQNIEAVMNEISRVLKSDGILYLTVNLHPPWGGVLHNIVSRVKIDRGHPHTFTIPKIQEFIRRYGYTILYEEWEDYSTCRRNDLKSKDKRSILKGLCGLTEFLYTSVSQKSDDNPVT